MTRKLVTVLAALACAAALCAQPTYAGSIERATHMQNRNKCKEAVAPKGLKGAAYKAEMSKCAAEGDDYK